MKRNKYILTCFGAAIDKEVGKCQIFEPRIAPTSVILMTSRRKDS